MQIPTSIFSTSPLPALKTGSFLMLLLVLSGCGDEVTRLSLNADEEAQILHLQNPFGDNRVSLVNKHNQTAIYLGLSDCKVYRATVKMGVITQWRVSLKPEFYPTPTVCSVQTLAVKEEYVIAKLGETAFGAGGCCATGGTYRTLDGETWEKHLRKNKWEINNPEISLDEPIE